MFKSILLQPSDPAKRLKPVVGIAAAALFIGWAAGVGAQTGSAPTPPPLPSAEQASTAQNDGVAAPDVSQPGASQQQASLPANGTAQNLPPLPLGHDDVREVQNQLIALGFDPGAADGEIGPATTAAAQQYDQNRGGTGQVSIDSELLARLKADTAPRLSYEQVAARSQARQQAQASALASAPSSAASQFGGIVQQIAPLIGAAIANSNNNGGYGPGYYGPGPGYYGPPPGYARGYGYGGF